MAVPHIWIVNQSGIKTLVNIVKSLKKINRIAAETHSETTSLKVKLEQEKLLKWEEHQLLSQHHMFLQMGSFSTLVLWRYR